MKQLASLCKVICLSTALGISFMQAMENPNQIIIGNIAFDLLNLPHEISPQITCLRENIEACLTIKDSCTKYYDLLTYEVIGNHCRRYSQEEKDIFLSYKMACMRDRIKLRDKFIVATLICAGAYLRDRHKVLELAVKHDDTELAEIVLHNPGILDLNGNVRISDDCLYFFSHDIHNTYGRTPLFFMIKSLDMIKLFIEHGADIHATMGDDTNVLWYVLKNDYPSELMEFYLNQKVDAALVNLYAKNRCILHKLASTHYSGSSTYDPNNLIAKAKLLIDATPGNINLVDSDNKTPTDAAYENLKYAKKLLKSDGDKVAVIACQALVAVFENHGGLTAEKARQQEKKLAMKEVKSKKRYSRYKVMSV